jgi:hypothetical protein
MRDILDLDRYPLDGSGALYSEAERMGFCGRAA